MIAIYGHANILMQGLGEAQEGFGLPWKGSMKELEQYFKALSDVNRLRILNLLLHGELCVCDIQHVLRSSQPTVSRHLAYLKNSGLVLDRRDGLRIFYRLAEPKHGTRKRLFEFLQDAYKNEQELQDDTARLKEAIKGGSCIVSDWKPYSALGSGRALQGGRV
jgi:ArsR family transcriptional regulator